MDAYAKTTSFDSKLGATITERRFLKSCSTASCPTQASVMREPRVSRREAGVLVVRLVAQVCKVVREGLLPSNDNIEKADYCGTWAAAAVRFLLEAISYNYLYHVAQPTAVRNCAR
jgi:hypothetical protein